MIKNTNTKVEINNAKEEMHEIISQCNKCGLCKELDSIWLATRHEPHSFRAKAILMQNNKLEPEIIFNDSLCNACKNSCPFDINIDNALRHARKILNLEINN